MIITPEIKDELLAIIAKHEQNTVFNPEDFSQELGISAENISLIIANFQKIGLVELKNLSGRRELIFPKAELFELIYIGGFQAREEFLKLELQKLHLEIEKLKSVDTTLAERLLTNLANIASLYGAISVFKS